MVIAKYLNGISHYCVKTAFFGRRKPIVGMWDCPKRRSKLSL